MCGRFRGRAGRGKFRRTDGKELYYLAPDNKLMAATIAAQAESIISGNPVALFTANFARNTMWRAMAASW